MADKQADIPARPKRVCVLGSTGSIGTQTLDVARRHPEFVKIVALSANTQAELLFEQAREFSVEHAVLANAEIAEAWRARFAKIGATLHAGPEAIVEAVQPSRSRYGGEFPGGSRWHAGELRNARGGQAACAC